MVAEGKQKAFGQKKLASLRQHSRRADEVISTVTATLIQATSAPVTGPISLSKSNWLLNPESCLDNRYEDRLELFEVAGVLAF